MVEELVLDPLSTVLNSFISALPGISAFIVIFAAGLLISWILGKITKGILKGTGFDRWFVKTGLNKTLGNISPSGIVGTIIKWWVFIAFFATATDYLDLGPISDLLMQLAQWLPNAVIAAIIVIVGWIAVNILTVKLVSKEVVASKMFAAVVKVILLVFIALIALSQIGIKISLAENSILIIVAGIMLGVGLAIGKGFGSALEEHAESILKSLRII